MFQVFNGGGFNTRSRQEKKSKAPRKCVPRSKAHEILHHKEVRGYPLTAKQQRFFGVMAHGKKRQCVGEEPVINFHPERRRKKK